MTYTDIIGLGEFDVEVEFEFDEGCPGGYWTAPTGVEINIVAVKTLKGHDHTALISKYPKIVECLEKRIYENYLENKRKSKFDEP